MKTKKTAKTNNMFFTLSMGRFRYLLKKLYCDNIFPAVIVTQKNQKIVSCQKEEHGRTLRFLKFNQSFFIDIGKCEKSITIDVKKISGILKDSKEIPDNTLITVTTNDKKFIVSTKTKKYSFGWKQPEERIVTSLPFPMEKGVPIIGDKKIRLETHFIINNKSYKSLGKNMKSFDTEFITFYFLKGKLKVRIGDLHDFSDFVIIEPKSKIISGKQLSVVVTYLIRETENVFDGDVYVKTKTDSPMWIYEGSDDMVNGFLIPPFVPDEEEE